MKLLKNLFFKKNKIMHNDIDDIKKEESKPLNAHELRSKFSASVIEEKRIKYEQENAKYIEADIQGRVTCNFRSIEYAIQKGLNKIEIDSRHNCCLNEAARKRFGEMGYVVTEEDFKYLKEGRELTYTIYTISW